MAPKKQSFKSFEKTKGIIGFRDIASLDSLIRTSRDLIGEDTIPTKVVIDVLSKELSSEFFSRLHDRVKAEQHDRSTLEDLTNLLRSMPENFYFFLWSLKNSEVLPVEGVIRSSELKKAVFILLKFLISSDLHLKSGRKNSALCENLGLVYFDLAGVAQYTKDGLSIHNKRLGCAILLRKAVACWQTAIKSSANQAQRIDSSHLQTLNLVNDGTGFEEDRTKLYLNPWHYFYISSALEHLNDRTGAKLYLNKVRSILNSIQDHQNPRIVRQRKLLEALYTSVSYGAIVDFDFDKSKLADLRRKLRSIQEVKKGNASARKTYSPIVETALLEQYKIESSFQRNGHLNTEQMGYLQGISYIYSGVHSAHERDKLIFHLNIPPLKVKGASDLKFLLSARAKSFPQNGALARSLN